MRYFFEELPDLHIVPAGLSLDFAVTVERLSYLRFGPMIFPGNVLLALEKDPIAAVLTAKTDSLVDSAQAQIIAELQNYFFIGGMPAGAGIISNPPSKIIHSVATKNC